MQAKRDDIDAGLSWQRPGTAMRVHQSVWLLSCRQCLQCTRTERCISRQQMAMAHERRSLAHERGLSTRECL